MTQTPFSEADYSLLASIVFRPGYPGYRPNVVESPNGDGKLDSDKRYAHIATKYLDKSKMGRLEYRTLHLALEIAHDLAVSVFRELNLPSTFFPVESRGALRVLEYPVDAISNVHTDFDLFTLMMYRDQPDRFYTSRNQPPEHINSLNPGIHYGEIMELLGAGEATPHSVLPSDTVQHSIVYFAIPAWESILPDGRSVETYLNERLSRSRY